MTDPDYRGRGLSRWLIDRVLEDFEQQVDFIFLYANDSVLDFYPKLGFKRAPEFLPPPNGLVKTGLLQIRLISASWM